MSFLSDSRLGAQANQKQAQQQAAAQQQTQTAAAALALSTLQTKLQTNQPLDVYDYVVMSKNYPDAARNIAAQQTRAQTIAQKMASGQPLDLYEMLFLATYSPNIARQIAQHQINVGYTGDTVTSTPTSSPVTSSPSGPAFVPTYVIAPSKEGKTGATLQKVSSLQEQFWVGHGYPEYSTYEVPSIPSAMVISNITKGPEGKLNISYAYAPNALLGPQATQLRGPLGRLAENIETYLIPSTSISEQLMKWSPAPVLPQLGLGYRPASYDPMTNIMQKLGRQPQIYPLEGFAGLVAPAESAVYTVANLAGLKTPTVPTPSLERPQFTSGWIMGNVLGILGTASAASSALGTALPITVKSVVTAAALNVGIKEGLSVVLSGKLIANPTEILETAFQGGEFAVLGSALGSAAILGLSKASQPIGVAIASSKLGRVAVGSGVTGLISFVTSKFSAQAAAQGLLLGFGMGLGQEYIINPLANELRMRLPESLGGTTPIEQGDYFTGKMGERVPTYISKEPIERLGGKYLEIIGDVSRGDMTIQDMIDQYVGREVPTGHATLHPEGFDLGVGEKTLIEGFPERSSGFRQTEQLFHFYSAPPSSEDVVTSYGGYIGLGGSESEQAPRIELGGKPTLLVTEKTFISPELLPKSNESMEEFFQRFGEASGQTGISPETVWGKSSEVQLSTPAAYVRGEEQLPGSLFESEGKVGTFTIKQMPEGILGDIPILRSMLSTYTNVGVYKGEFLPIESLDLSGLSGLKTTNIANIISSNIQNISPPSIMINPASFSAAISFPNVSIPSMPLTVPKQTVSPFSIITSPPSSSPFSLLKSFPTGPSSESLAASIPKQNFATIVSNMSKPSPLNMGVESTRNISPALIPISPSSFSAFISPSTVSPPLKSPSLSTRNVPSVAPDILKPSSQSILKESLGLLAPPASSPSSAVSGIKFQWPEKSTHAELSVRISLGGSSQKSQALIPSIPSIPSTPSTSSTPSESPSLRSFVSRPSTPSIFSKPSIFSTPSKPSTPSIFSKSSAPSAPSFPSVSSKPSSPSSQASAPSSPSRSKSTLNYDTKLNGLLKKQFTTPRKPEYWLRKYPVLTAGQVEKNLSKAFPSSHKTSGVHSSQYSFSRKLKGMMG